MISSFRHAYPLIGNPTTLRVSDKMADRMEIVTRCVVASGLVDAMPPELASKRVKPKVAGADREAARAWPAASLVPPVLLATGWLSAAPSVGGLGRDFAVYRDAFFLAQQAWYKDTAPWRAADAVPLTHGACELRWDALLCVGEDDLPDHVRGADRTVIWAQIAVSSSAFGSWSRADDATVEGRAWSRGFHAALDCTLTGCMRQHFMGRTAMADGRDSDADVPADEERQPLRPFAEPALSEGDILRSTAPELAKIGYGMSAALASEFQVRLRRQCCANVVRVRYWCPIHVQYHSDYYSATLPYLFISIYLPLWPRRVA